MERLLIAKGRGIATNVPENELIKQVRRRPLLYDKNASEYRKVKGFFLKNLQKRTNNN